MNTNENMTLADCLEYIRHELRHFDHPNLDTVGIEKSLERIDELTRWIPVEERLPTIEDSDWNGMVAWKHQVMYGGVSFHPWNESPEWHGKNIRTHWKRIENL